MHCKLKQITVTVSGTLCYGITDELQSVQNAVARLVTGIREAMRS